MKRINPSLFLLPLVLLLHASASVHGLIEVIKTGELYPDRNADFGPKLPMDGLSGVLIPIEHLDEANQSNLGCKSFKKTATETKEGIEVPWIALVQRGGCSFVQKVKAMQESGASGVIVGGNTPDGGLVRMFAPENEAKGIKIHSAYIMKWEYDNLLNMMASMEGQGQKQSTNYKINTLTLSATTMPHLIIKMLPDGFDDWPLIDVAVVALLIPLIVVLILWIIWKCKFGDESFFDDINDYDTIYLTPRRIPPHELPASVEAVNNLPKKIYQSKSRAINDPEICAICLDDFEDEEELRKLPCKHEFHIGCIDPWLLTRKRFCPVCKGDSCPTVDSDDTVIRDTLQSTSHSRSSSPSTTTSSVSFSASSIILNPTPNPHESVLIEIETEPLLRNTITDNRENSENFNINNALSPATTYSVISNTIERRPRNSLLSVLSRTWRSTSSVLSNMSSAMMMNPNSSPQRSRTPFPVADPDDYENARRLALENRRRREVTGQEH